MASFIGSLLVLSVWAAAIVGWVWNIVKIVNVCCVALDGILILRIVGVFVAPLGAVMGYL